MKSVKSFTVLLILILSLSGCTTSPLMDAVIDGDIKKTNALLGQGADINECSRYTPLMRAARIGHIEMAKLLLDKGADINATCGGYTAIIWAVYYERNEIVKLLLDRGADVNAMCGGYTALMWAVNYVGQIEMVKLLLDRGADVNIYSAVNYGLTDRVKHLLDRGADDNNYSGDNWNTALHLAIYNGYNDIIQLLLERGADVYPQHIKEAVKKKTIKYSILKMLRESRPINTQAVKYKQGLLLAVIDFKPRGVSRRIAKRLSEWLRTELINTGQFKVIERSAMNEILKEQAFSLTGCTDTSCAIKVGKLLSARKMLVGNVESWEGKILINGRIIDVEKGIAEFAHKETVSSLKDLDTGATNFAENLARKIKGHPVH